MAILQRPRIRLRCGRVLEPELSGLRELLRYRVGFVTLPPARHSRLAGLARDPE